MTKSMTDRPLLGIVLMLAFCLGAPIGDALAKMLGTELSVTQITTLRFAFQGGLLLPLALVLRRSFRMDRTTFGLLAARSVIHVVAIFLVVQSLLYLPLADFVAITYVMPFMALLLGWLVLGESVGPHRILACIAGFGGTLLVLQPAFLEVGPPALLPMALALAFSVYMLLSRKLGPRLDPIAQQAAAAPIALAILLPILWLTPDTVSHTQWRPIPASLWPLIAAMGAVGTFSHLLMAAALKYAPASTLAPMQYLEIPFATLLGWLIWHDLPGPLAWVGITITVASGLYIIWREQRANAVRLPIPPTTPPA